MRISDWSSDVCSSDLTTTTAEAATEAGPNGGSGEECDNTDNVDVDSYNFTVTVNPTTQPPDRKRVVSGKRVSVRVETRARSTNKKKQNTTCNTSRTITNTRNTTHENTHKHSYT